MLPNTVTVLIDSREHKSHRLLFPRWIEVHEDRTLAKTLIEIKTKVVAMPAGDYTIEGRDDVCIIETKRSLRELYNNVCTDDWVRTARALKRLSDACEYPYLVLELTPSELFYRSIHVHDPLLVFDRWMQAVAHFNLRLMLVGGAHTPGPRRKLGEQLVRLMLAHISMPPGKIRPWSEEFRKTMWDRAATWTTKGEGDELRTKA